MINIQVDIVSVTKDVASDLAMLTQPTDNSSILPLDIQNTNDIVGSLLMSAYTH